VTLVRDHEVEEVRREVAEHAACLLAAVRQLLVQPEVDLPSGLGFALQLPDRCVVAGPERWLEFALDRLVDEDVAVSEVEDPRIATGLPSALPQFPDDLHRHERLARTRGHEHPPAERSARADVLYSWTMTRRADDLPNDPVLVVVDDEEPTMTFDDWLALLATDEPTEVDADAAEMLREIREHGER